MTDILKHRAKLRIPEQQIIRMLDLPEGTQIRVIQSEFDPPSISIVVVHPDLSEVPDGAEAPYVPPAELLVERLYAEDKVWHRSTVKWRFE